jgi:hypothetical protein
MGDRGGGYPFRREKMKNAKMIDDSVGSIRKADIVA